MSEGTLEKVRINLENAVILLVDNSLGIDILASIFKGFGVRNLYKARSVVDAQKVIEDYQVDLIIMESLMVGEDLYAFIQTLRRREGDENRFAPVVLLSAHTAASRVHRTRDCGANFLVGKPLSAKVLLERIWWIAKGKRQFLESEGYIGPDRRFNDVGPPAGVEGRRRTDGQKTIEDATTPPEGKDEVVS